MPANQSISGLFSCKQISCTRVLVAKGPADATSTAADRQYSRGVGLAETTDQLLLSRLRSGERAAFEELAHLHGAGLVRLAHRLLGWSGDGDAQDVVQDVLARLMAHPHRIAARDGHLEGWLVAVTVNQCRTHQRRWLARLKALRRKAEQPAAGASRVDRETDEMVRRVVARMPPRDREVIVLHYLEEMPVDAMAPLLGISRNAVEVRLHRARGRLKVRLEPMMKD